MNSIFIPEDKVGTITSTRADIIVSLASKRERAAAMRELSRLMQYTQLIPPTQQVYAVAYGCDIAGIRGVLVAYGEAINTVSTAKEPSNG